MRKLALLTALAFVFLFTGIAAATDFTLSGSYYARGTYRDNLAGTGKDVEAFGNYDHELSVDATWQIDDTTKVFARFEMRDENWGAMGSGSENGNVGAENDDNIVLERVWGSHTFANGGTLTTGLMLGGVWGTAWGEAGYDAYRIKYVQPTSFGTFLGVIQKTKEGGAVGNADDDKVDNDGYMLGLISKIGSVDFKPLIVYVDNETADSGNGGTVLQFQLALGGGDKEGLSWEAEAHYYTYDDYNVTGASYGDTDVWGLYAKLDYVMGPATWSILGAYGSYDDDTNMGFSFGDDFEAGGALIIGDDMELVGADLGAGYLIAAKVSYDVNDKLNLGAYLGYWAGDTEDGETTYGVDDADAWEISVRGAYKITANLTYKAAIGYAQADDLGATATRTAQPDPDEAIEIHHRLDFSF